MAGIKINLETSLVNSVKMVKITHYTSGILWCTCVPEGSAAVGLRLDMVMSRSAKTIQRFKKSSLLREMR